MKNYKIISTFLCLLIVFVLMLAACGEKDEDASGKDVSKSDETTAIAETTAIIETTNDGGTVEKDSEGNKIKKDAEGKVISVEDKDGNPIDVDEYVTTHSWIESNSVSGNGSSNNSSGNNSGSTGNSGGSSSKNGSSSSKSGSSSSKDNVSSDAGKNDSVDNSSEMTEGEIPVVIATIPDNEDDLEVLPDL